MKLADHCDAENRLRSLASREWLVIAMLAAASAAGGCQAPSGPAGGNGAQPHGAQASPASLPQASKSHEALAKFGGASAVVSVFCFAAPRSQRDGLARIWSYLREDWLDAETAARLRRNGIRTALGREDYWDAVRQILDGIEDRRVFQHDAVRLPPNYPLALELDSGPRDQTLFYVADDGVLTGETWGESRNVLRLDYLLDLQRPGAIILEVVPEVRRRQDGTRFVRTDTGVMLVPRYDGRAFAAASFAARLEPGDFLVVAPSEQSDVYGIVGGAFLTEAVDGEPFDSLVFVRTDLSDVIRRP
ncbi:hypothetical protein RAS1_12590 [Phycisphaerae bacterium RAS1]|nr:hypothetical protein RAS1_12590 [Phycisphaerae bacterium RAS1]